MKTYFNTKDEALQYKEKHKLYTMAANYIPCRQKWALVLELEGSIDCVPSNMELRKNHFMKGGHNHG